MRSFIAILFMAAVCCSASSYPADTLIPQLSDVVEANPGVRQQSIDIVEKPVEEILSRHKRATCDIGSAFKVNHAACAIHCVAKGFKGGWCNGQQVCNCRR